MERLFHSGIHTVGVSSGAGAGQFLQKQGIYIAQCLLDTCRQGIRWFGELPAWHRTNRLDCQLRMDGAHYGWIGAADSALHLHVCLVDRPRR